MININKIKWSFNKKIHVKYDDSIKLLFTCDEKYLKILPITLNSFLFFNRKKIKEIEVFILGREFSNSNILFLKKYINHHNFDLTLNFFVIHEDIFSEWNANFHSGYNIEVLFKLLFFREEWQPLKTAICLDVDAIFLKDFNFLELRGNDWYIKGVVDHNLCFLSNKKEIMDVKEDVSSKFFNNFNINWNYYFNYHSLKWENYINAGFFILNCSKNENKNFEECKKLFKNKYLHLFEQDCINIIFKNKITLLPVNFNYLSCYNNEWYKERVDLNNKKDIIYLHFAGPYKPWKKNNFIFNNKFFIKYKKQYSKTFKMKDSKLVFNPSINFCIEQIKYIIYLFIFNIIKILFWKKTKKFINSLNMFIKHL